MNEHADLHYGAGAKGFVAVLNRKQGNPYYCWVEELPELLAARPKTDLYFTLNTFAQRNTAAENVWQFTATYVGLDTRLAGIDRADALEDMKRFFFGSEVMPVPSYAVLSGNGVWVVWLIDPVTIGSRSDWQRVQDHFRSALTLFNPDPNDASKYIRVAGSTNSSSRSRVRLEVLREQRYTLAELLEYAPERPQPAQKPRKRPKRTGDIRKATVTKSPLELLWARNSDLRRLVVLRRGEFHHQRNHVLLIYAATVHAAKQDLDDTLTQALHLNERLSQPLAVSQVRAICRTVERHGYSWKTQTIIETLQITAEEQRGMKTLIGPAEAASRRRRREEKRRRAKGAKDRQVSAEQTRMEIQAIKAAEPISNREIARRLGVSEGTVRNALRSVPQRCVTKTPLFRRGTPVRGTNPGGPGRGVLRSVYGV